MMDWRQNGEVIRNRVRQFLSHHAIRDGDVIVTTTSGQHVQSKHTDRWIASVPLDWLIKGIDKPYNKSRFDYREWLRSKSGLLNRDWDEWRPKNGRPVAEATRMAATLAEYFYEAWRRENSKASISDYGHRSAMKEFAARVVVEDIFALQFAIPKLAWQFAVKGPDEFVETVRALMDKSKRRKEVGAAAQLDYVASPVGLAFDLPPKPTQD